MGKPWQGCSVKPCGFVLLAPHSAMHILSPGTRPLVSTPSAQHGAAPWYVLSKCFPVGSWVPGWFRCFVRGLGGGDLFSELVLHFTSCSCGHRAIAPGLFPLPPCQAGPPSVLEVDEEVKAEVCKQLVPPADGCHLSVLQCSPGGHQCPCGQQQAPVAWEPRLFRERHVIAEPGLILL